MNQLNFEVICHLTQDESETEAKKLLKKESDLRPCLVFGMFGAATWLKDYGITAPYYHVKDDASALDAAKNCNGKTTGLVFLEDEFSVGFDLRFKKEPLVVVVSRERPFREDLMQKFARGARSLCDTDGVLFTKGNAVDAISIKNQILMDEGQDFYEADQLIKLMFNRRSTNQGAKQVKRMI